MACRPNPEGPPSLLLTRHQPVANCRLWHPRRSTLARQPVGEVEESGPGVAVDGKHAEADTQVTKEQEWSIEFEVAGPGPFSEVFADEVIEQLEGRGPVVSLGDKRGAVRFNVEAPDATSAFIQARDSLTAVLVGLVDAEIIAAEISTVEELDRRLNEQNLPSLVGVAELAAQLGVSKQRASELAEQESFPTPVARLRSGPVWTAPSVSRFVDSWPRRRGRPAKPVGRRPSSVNGSI